MIDLAGKVIVVTGATSGIGRQCAITCSQLGASVAVMGRNRDRLDETMRSLAGGEHLALAHDLKEVQALGALVSRISADLGPISGFVHAAGVQVTKSLATMLAEDYSEVMSVNVVSAFELARIISRKEHLDPKGAGFVFIASVMGSVARPGLVAYCASKGALTSGARSMALELCRKRVTVNTISPGMIRTTLLDEHLAMLSESQLADRLKLYPLGPGTPQDVASMCAFLLSDHARWITGTNVVIDGGYSAQ